MKLPPELGSLQDLKRREKQAFEHNTYWHDTLEDAYEYFLPNRNLFETEAVGQKKMDRIFVHMPHNIIMTFSYKAKFNNFEFSESLHIFLMFLKKQELFCHDAAFCFKQIIIIFRS